MMLVDENYVFIPLYQAEEEKYFTSILDTVRWLGFEPFKITHSSDYFQDLYELAIKLIKKGLVWDTYWN